MENGGLMKKMVTDLTANIVFAVGKVRKKLTKQKIKLNDVMNLLGIFLLLWFGVSCIDVILHNNPGTSGYERYAGWNLIEIINTLRGGL